MFQNNGARRSDSGKETEKIKSLVNVVVLNVSPVQVKRAVIVGEKV